MAIVTAKFSLASAGVALLSTELDQGAASPGNNTVEQTIYISHDGLYDIKNCKIYLMEKSGVYSGLNSPLRDKLELISWGDSTTASLFGGIQLNFDADGGFPSSAWGTVSDKSPTNGVTLRTGYGDVSENGILLPMAMGLTTAGIIPAGVAVPFKMRLTVPDSVSDAGIRQFDLRLRFSYSG